MLNFEAYKQKDLQHFIQILNKCESEGITDIRFVREAVHKHIYRPQEIRPTKRKINTPIEPKCPECGGIMYPAKNERPGEYIKVDGKNVLVCGKCRYSELVK